MSDALRFDHFIDGRFVAPTSGQYLDVFDPASGQVFARAAAGDATDIDLAVNAAQLAFPRWSRTPAEERTRLLLRVADLIEQNLDRLAQAESRDCGKPIAAARSVDIPRAVQNFRFFATAITHAASEAHLTDDVAVNYTTRRPRGVCGLISPWNLPLYLLSWKIAPALACGNTAVAKPSEITPYTAHLLAELCATAGLPSGVLNIVHGYGRDAGHALVDHPLASTISFTGGTATGREIARSAAAHLKKISLELGGKNAHLIFADADLGKAIPMAIKAAFSNQGQICLCGSRLLVEESIVDEVVAGLVRGAQALQIGDPLDPATQHGALVSRAHLDKVRGYIQLARDEGGRILCGGRIPPALPARCRDGYFLEPTVISGLGPHARCNQEEIFGPVVTVLPFKNEAEAVEIANGTMYGLSASLWTENVGRAHRVADALQSGTVWVNCWLLRDLRVPFGGMKQSGIGREGGDEALRFYTEPKNICVRVPRS